MTIKSGVQVLPLLQRKFETSLGSCETLSQKLKKNKTTTTKQKQAQRIKIIHGFSLKNRVLFTLKREITEHTKESSYSSTSSWTTGVLRLLIAYNIMCVTEKQLHFLECLRQFLGSYISIRALIPSLSSTYLLWVGKSGAEMPHDGFIKPCDMLGSSEPQDIHESHTS